MNITCFLFDLLIRKFGTSYAAQAKNGCTKPITQTPPKDPKDDEQKLCAELTDKSQCCNKNETDCIQKLCDGNEEFKKKYTDLCATEEKPIKSADNLCKTKSFSVKDWDTVFKNTISVKVKTAEMARVLAEELLKCTSNVEGYTIPITNYAKYGKYDTRAILADDYISVNKPKKESKSDTDDYSDITYIRFDSINENSWYTSEYAFFSALCYIAGGTISTTDSRMCNNINQAQCDVFKTIVVTKHNNQYECLFDQNSCKCRYNKK